MRAVVLLSSFNKSTYRCTNAMRGSVALLKEDDKETMLPLPQAHQQKPRPWQAISPLWRPVAQASSWCWHSCRASGQGRSGGSYESTAVNLIEFIQTTLSAAAMCCRCAEVGQLRWAARNCIISTNSSLVTASVVLLELRYTMQCMTYKRMTY
jgi:hypothetical protein